MGDLTAQKKRLKLHRDLLKVPVKWNPEKLKRNLRLTSWYDTASLKAAAAHFGLDHAGPSHLAMLILILADVVFGKRNPGRRKGDAKTWDEPTLLVLWKMYEDARRRHPKITSDEDFAYLISDTPEFKAYRDVYDSEQIRQRLPELRQAMSENAEVESEIFNSALSEGDGDH